MQNTATTILQDNLKNEADAELGNVVLDVPVPLARLGLSVRGHV